METWAQRRRQTQPREASAGCVFRNPPGAAAGQLIEAAGLKGHTVGGVMVSPVHANFLVQQGDARSEDFIQAMKDVRQAVRQQQGIELEPEIIALGHEWKELL
jgi:UDP-N-acetylenolpyruvoylglucosamine reductase